MRGLEIAGEVGIGAAQGYGELVWDATREALLMWATGGLYQAIHGVHFYSGLYAGYMEGGALGALSVLNPLAGILTPAENATHEAIKGDYRAAGREGIKAVIAAVITVVTIVIAPKVPEGKPGAGGRQDPPLLSQELPNQSPVQPVVQLRSIDSQDLFGRKRSIMTQVRLACSVNEKVQERKLIMPNHVQKEEMQPLKTPNLRALTAMRPKAHASSPRLLHRATRGPGLRQ